MARYRYAGPGPAEVWGVAEVWDGSLVRPGDVWEFPGEPTWGLWELVEDDAPEAAEAPSDPPPTQTPAGDAAGQPAANEAADTAGNGM